LGKEMQIGKLRHLIKIQSGTVSQDVAGEEILTWILEAERWASIEPLSGQERFLEAQIQADVTHKIGVRMAFTVTPKMRVLFGSRIFDILSVLNVGERDVKLKLICRENV